MAYSDGVITGIVSIADIQNCLLNYSFDVGTLCLDSNINEMSKKKPVYYGKKGALTETEWKNCKYGLTTYKTGAASAAETSNDGRLNGWVYNKPTGGNYAFRMLDFQGYKKNAYAPIEDVAVQSTYNMQTASELQMEISTSADDGYSIRLADVGLESYYYGVVSKMPNGNYIKICSPKKVSDYPDGCSISISNADLVVGTYKFWVVLFESQNADQFVTIPYINGVQCNVVNQSIVSAVDVNIDAWYADSYKRVVLYRVEWSNDGNETKNLNLNIYLGLNSSTSGSAIKQALQITATAGGSGQTSVFYQSGDFSQYGSVWLWATSNNSTRINNIAVEVEEAMAD